MYVLIFDLGALSQRENLGIRALCITEKLPFLRFFVKLLFNLPQSVRFIFFMLRQSSYRLSLIERCYHLFHDSGSSWSDAVGTFLYLNMLTYRHRCYLLLAFIFNFICSRCVVVLRRLLRFFVFRFLLLGWCAFSFRDWGFQNADVIFKCLLRFSLVSQLFLQTCKILFYFENAFTCTTVAFFA